MFGQLTFFCTFLPWRIMLNLLKNNKVLSILFGGMKNSSYFCISKFDKHINGINK